MADTPTRVLILDESRLTRQLLRKALVEHPAKPEIIETSATDEAIQAIQDHDVDLMITALRLSDRDGTQLADEIRGLGLARYFPIVVVSGDVQRRLHHEGGLAGVTDYFDKRAGFAALRTFVGGYLEDNTDLGGRVLLVEDSKVVAVATKRMLASRGLDVMTTPSVDGALEMLELSGEERPTQLPFDAVISDNYLEDNQTGGDLLEVVRDRFEISAVELPVIVVTGDDNLEHRAALLRAGANDLVGKPIDAETMVNKLRYQLRVRLHHLRLQDEQATT